MGSSTIGGQCEVISGPTYSKTGTIQAKQEDPGSLEQTAGVEMSAKFADNPASGRKASCCEVRPGTRTAPPTTCAATGTVTWKPGAVATRTTPTAWRTGQTATAGTARTACARASSTRGRSTSSSRSSTGATATKSRRRAIRSPYSSTRFRTGDAPSSREDGAEAFHPSSSVAPSGHPRAFERGGHSCHSARTSRELHRPERQEGADEDERRPRRLRLITRVCLHEQFPTPPAPLPPRSAESGIMGDRPTVGSRMPCCAQPCAEPV